MMADWSTMYLYIILYISQIKMYDMQILHFQPIAKVIMQWLYVFLAIFIRFSAAGKQCT